MAFLFCFVGTKCFFFFSFWSWVLLSAALLLLLCFRPSALALLSVLSSISGKNTCYRTLVVHVVESSPFQVQQFAAPFGFVHTCISDSSFKMSVEKQHILGEEGKRSAACAIMVVVVCLRHYYWFLPTIWGWAGAFRHPWKNARQSAGIEYPGTKGTRDL